MAEISTALVSEGDSKEQNEATKMSAKVAHHFNLSFVYAGLAQYLAVAKNLATAKLCSKVLIDAMHRKLLRRVRLSLTLST